MTRDVRVVLPEARKTMDELRSALGAFLVAHKIYRIPILDGTGASLKVPKDLDSLKAGDIFNLCEIFTKVASREVEAVAETEVPAPKLGGSL